MLITQLYTMYSGDVLNGDTVMFSMKPSSFVTSCNANVGLMMHISDEEPIYGQLSMHVTLRIK